MDDYAVLRSGSGYFDCSFGIRLFPSEFVAQTRVVVRARTASLPPHALIHLPGVDTLALQPAHWLGA